MKGNKMKWLGTIMGFFFLLLNSCESEEHMLENHNKEVEYIEKVTYHEFIQNLKSHKITTSKYLQAIFFEDPTNKSAKTNQFNIIVDKENVTKINAANALVTYNFNVTTNDPDPRDHFYKLLLIMQHGKYDLKLLKFLPNEISEQALKKDSPFKGTIQNMPLAYNPLVNRGCYGSSVLVTEFMPCVNHGFYSPQSNPYCAGGHYETRVETLTTCDVYDNGNGNGGGGGGTQNDDPNWVGTANNNAENSLVPSNYVGIYPIDFTPFYDGLIKYNNFKYQELTDEQLTYLNSNDDVSIAIKNYLLQNTDNSGNFTSEAKEFAKQLINLAINKKIPWEKITNWYSLTKPGIESDESSNDSFWDDLNLTFPQQNLPEYLDFKNNFPDKSITSKMLCTNIGGEILDLYNKIIATGNQMNTCAVRLSYALNHSGIKIPNVPGTKLGKDGKYYFTFASDLNKWMLKTFGSNSNVGLGPTNNNHVRYYSAHLTEYLNPANGNILNPNNPLNGIQGIFSLVSSNPKWSTGHCDILQTDSTCVNNCHFEGPIKYIDIWILP